MVGPGPSRRAVLAAGLLPLLAGACTSGAPVRPLPDPDAALREAAAERERDLLARYDRALQDASRPSDRLRALREEHAAHLAALAAPASPTAPASPGVPASPAPASPAPARDLLAAETAAAHAHAAAVPGASRRLAGLLASLAAAEASHAVALGAP